MKNPAQAWQPRPFTKDAFAFLDRTRMLRDSLRFHARLDVQTSDDRDFIAMRALTHARKAEKDGRGKGATKDLVSSVRKTLGQDPRKRPF